MKLQLKATRGGEGLEKGSKEHETATKSNERGRGIREGMRET